MSGTSLTPEEIRAAAETHHELGPDYQSAVIESFLDKVGKEIDAKVDARLAGQQFPQPQAPGQYQPGQYQPGQYQPGPYPPGQYQPGPYPPGQPFQPQPPAVPHRERTPFALAIVSMALGIPLSAIAVAAGPRPVGALGLVVIWLAIAVINVAYTLGGRLPSSRR